VRDEGRLTGIAGLLISVISIALAVDFVYRTLRA
jgi:hypothetical protein